MQASNPHRLDADAIVYRTGPVARGSVALLDGGRQAYPRMLQAIAGARRSVHIEMYCMKPDASEAWMSPSAPALAAASNASLRLGRAAASTSSLARRVGVAAVGLAVVGLGLARVVLLGPPLLVIPLGLTILAEESRRVRRLLASRARTPAAAHDETEAAARQSIGAHGLVACD